MKKVLYIFLTSTNLFASDLCIKSIHSIIKIYPEITCTKIQDAQPFHYKKFPISKFPQHQPYNGIFAQENIIVIPNGQVFSNNGYIKIDNNIVAECMWENEYSDQIKALRAEHKLLTDAPFIIPGRVAVIAQVSAKCYYIWITQVLDRLRMLQESGIEYDWIYASLDQPFMKETLATLNIDLQKIIDPKIHNYIQAEKIIALSAPARKTLPKNKLFCDNKNLASYCSDSLINYLREKFLPQIQAISQNNFAKKIFISRKDSHMGRHMQNEDEIFTLFEQNGFKRYCLTDFTVLEQAALFYGSEIIVAAHGAALANLIFCKPKTKLLEIFQARSSCTYWYMAQQLDLDYRYVKTMEFNESNITGGNNTTIPVQIFQNFINQNNDFLHSST